MREANELTAGQAIVHGGFYPGERLQISIVRYPGTLVAGAFSLFVTVLPLKGPSDEFDGVRAILTRPDGDPVLVEEFNKIGQLSFLDAPDEDYRIRFEV